MTTTTPSKHLMLINGRMTPAQDGTTYMVRSPATGEEIAEVPSANTGDVDRAVAAAVTAFAAFEASTPFERADWCHRIAEALDARREALAFELTMEHGKPISDSIAEVASAADGFRLAAEEAKRLTGQTIPVRDASKRVITIRRARGVYGVVTPWNFPLNIPVEYLGPALATGNAVVWKPAPTTPRIGLRLAECIQEADLPAGLINVLTSDSVDTARHLVSHPNVSGVCFTGSSRVGQSVAQAAVGKHQLLELGGNGPVIVLGDADLARAADAVGRAAFWNAGQSCAAAERILAEPAVYDGLIEGLADAARAVRLGQPWLDTTTMGPLHTEAVATTVERHVADAVTTGAKIFAGGSRLKDAPTQLYYQPTVVAEVAADAAFHLEETFGPVAPVTRATGDEQILQLANQCRLGLSCAIFTRNVARALRLAERIQCGSVVINDTSNYWELHLPFGGWPGKDSGTGRIGGRHTLEALTEIRTISVDLH